MPFDPNDYPDQLETEEAAELLGLPARHLETGRTAANEEN